MKFLILIALCSIASAYPGSRVVPINWSEQVRRVPWTLEPTTTLDWVMQVDGYDLELVHRAGEWGDLHIRVSRGGKLIYQWKGTSETPLAVRGDTLYYVEHGPISSGAAVVAVDLATGKQRWLAALKGIGPQSHSKYRNVVWFDVKDDVITVQGEESHGKYVEIVDRKTGKTLANDVRK